MLGAFGRQLCSCFYIWTFSFSMLKDERVKQVHKRSIFQALEDDLTDRTGWRRGFLPFYTDMAFYIDRMGFFHFAYVDMAFSFFSLHLQCIEKSPEDLPFMILRGCSDGHYRAPSQSRLVRLCMIATRTVWFNVASTFKLKAQPLSSVLSFVFPNYVCEETVIGYVSFKVCPNNPSPKKSIHWFL